MVGLFHGMLPLPEKCPKVSFAKSSLLTGWSFSDVVFLRIP